MIMPKELLLVVDDEEILICNKQETSERDATYGSSVAVPCCLPSRLRIGTSGATSELKVRNRAGLHLTCVTILFFSFLKKKKNLTHLDGTISVKKRILK
jgi:hypothetical protein